MPVAFHAQSLLHGLTGLRFGHPVHLYRQTGSTNAVARGLAEAGAREGVLVVAEAQSAGRGRIGRRWITTEGTALAFSLVLRPAVPPAQAARLTMLAGLAVCEGIERVCGLSAELKWPNDILIGGRKAGGILLEAASAGGPGQAPGDGRLEYAILGIGLNVEQAPLPEQVDFPATALQLESGRPVDRLELLRAILQRLEAHYPRLAASDAGALRDDWAARLAWLGEPVVAHTPEGDYAGLAEGTDVDGALIVRLESGERLRVRAGDVRLRPLAPLAEERC
jgi:BirA family biotin operon repressor/biotin-[acetyl-CoA-carboxylase] ligase